MAGALAFGSTGPGSPTGRIDKPLFTRETTTNQVRRVFGRWSELLMPQSGHEILGRISGEVSEYFQQMRTENPMMYIYYRGQYNAFRDKLLELQTGEKRTTE